LFRTLVNKEALAPHRFDLQTPLWKNTRDEACKNFCVSTGENTAISWNRYRLANRAFSYRKSSRL